MKFDNNTEIIRDWQTCTIYVHLLTIFGLLFRIECESVSRCFLNEKAFSVIVKTCAKIRWSVDGVVNVLMCNVVCNLITRVLCLLSIPHTNNNSRLYLHYSSSQPKLNRNTLHLYYQTTKKVLLYKRRSSHSILLLSSVSSTLLDSIFQRNINIMPGWKCIRPVDGGH